MLKVAIFIGRTRLEHRAGCYRVGWCCTQARFSAGVGFDWLFYSRRVRPRAGHRSRLAGLDAGRGGIDILLCGEGLRDAHRGDFVRASAALEQLGLDPLGALEPPGGAGDAPGEHALERALGCQLLDQRCLERGKFLRVLVADHDEFLGAKTALQGVLRRSRFTFLRPGSARLRAVAPARRGARGCEADVHGMFSKKGEAGG
jgi:hypothetical protein